MHTEAVKTALNQTVIQTRKPRTEPIQAFARPGRSMLGLIATLCMIASIAGCTPAQQVGCALGEGSPMQVVTLYFGKSIPGRGELTDAEWLSFLDTTITANLPNGFTVVDASGGWTNPISHKTIKENTKVLIVALPQTHDGLIAVNRIRTAYQSQFQQQLVGMTVERACGSF